MRGWLVYSPEGYGENAWFADRILACAAARKIALTLRLVAAGEMPPQDGLPDFALVRAMRPDLSRFLEERGVRVFNNAETARVANDKYATYRLARTLALPVLPTRLLDEAACAALTEPTVVKTTDGHGGNEVFCVRAPDAARALLRRFPTRRLVAQPLCDEPGRDMRVYATGSGILSAVLRTSRTDFRSNFKLGGSVCAVTPDAGVSDAVNALRERLRFDFVGVDFIRHAGRWVLNEIEDPVGTRMLYKTTGIDAAACLVHGVATG